MTSAGKLASLSILLALFAVSVGSLGCGGSGDLPELGEVTGKVTLDGLPFANVIVSFRPENGRTAQAVTDSEGNYEAVYSPGVNGAKVGPNKVFIRYPDGSDEEAAERTPIPAKYDVQTELKVDVKPGKNDNVNFELVSK